MKKLLILTLMFGTMAFVVPSVDARTATNAVTADPQVRVQIGNSRYRRRWNNRRARVVTTTRITRVGRYRYRETIRVTYFPNGRTRTQVIRRVRIGRNWNY